MSSPDIDTNAVEMYGAFPSLVFEPLEMRRVRGHGTQINRRLVEGIALADVAIQQLLISGYALNSSDFEMIYEQNGANPNTAKTNMVSDIRNRRFPTRIGLAIREVKTPIKPFYLDAELAYEDTDLATRLG